MSQAELGVGYFNSMLNVIWFLCAFYVCIDLSYVFSAPFREKI